MFYIAQDKIRVRKVESSMRKGWKMLAGVLGGAMLVCSGYEGVPVRAEEGGAVSAEAQSEKPAIQKATDLKWNEKGQGIFTSKSLCLWSGWEENDILARRNYPRGRNSI